MPKSTRCTFRQGRQRCTFNGTGTPCLCQAHRVALAEAARPRSPVEVLGRSIVDFLQGSPVNGEATIGAIRDLAQSWSGNVGSDYRPNVSQGESEASVHRRGQSGISAPWWWAGQAQAARQQPQPPPPPPPEDEEIRKRSWARKILGIKPDEQLTEVLIKTKYRRLSRRNHPDVGGSTAKQADINTARDILTSAL